LSVDYASLIAKLSDAIQKIQAIDKILERGTVSMMNTLPLEEAMPLTAENITHLQNERARLKARKDEICDTNKAL